ncbi:hypothetical protein SAMN05216369_0283 [Marinobacter antarcticus]|uniref:Uncharacterized protein n=1 Tax=Marinobacter antarcticus TaxID=564117 RepID=A0A1M6PGH7_9GAMM|nr:hypothetical protein SAMN05216369_0283 [Marinobacter antarcticus]
MSLKPGLVCITSNLDSRAGAIKRSILREMNRESDQVRKQACCVEQGVVQDKADISDAAGQKELSPHGCEHFS